MLAVALATSRTARAQKGNGPSAPQPSAVSSGVLDSAGPLNKIFAGVDAATQIAHTTDGATYEVYPSSTTPGDYGTFLVINGILYTPDFNGHGVTATASLGTHTVFTPVSQSAVTGTGAVGNPLQVVTVVDAGATGLRITQTDSYVVGQESYRTDVTVSNLSGGTQSAILYRALDCYLGSSDFGYGFVDPVSGSVGCSKNANNTPPGRVEQLIPLSSGSKYLETFYSTLWAKIGTKVPFPNTCDCATNLDNAAGLSWAITVPAGGQLTRSHLTVFSPIGVLGLLTAKTADAARSLPSTANGYTITVTNPNGTSVSLSEIFDDLPAGFTYTPGSTTGITTANPTIVGQHLTWTGPFSVPTTGSVNLHFNVTVASSAGTYFNEASAEAGAFTVAATGPTAPIGVGQFPTLLSIAPEAGPSIGGTTVTITGSNFLNGVSVTIGDYPCFLTSFSGTELKCTTHAHPAGPVDVVVTNPDGSADTLTGAYTYICVDSLPTAAVSGAASICLGDFTNLSVSLTGAPPWALTWSDGFEEIGITTTPHLRSVSPTLTTTYSVSVVADTLCANTGTGFPIVIVKNVSSVISAPVALCVDAVRGASVPDAGVGATYSWSITNGTIQNGAGTHAITFQAGILGIVKLDVTVTAQGCISSSSVNIPVEVLPTASLSGDNTICSGKTTPLTVNLTGTPPWTLTFSDSFIATDILATPYVRDAAPTSDIVYTLTAIDDAKGCGGSGSGSATVHVLPSPSAAITTPTLICHDTAIVNASVPNAGAGATYLWGITNGTITGGQGTRAITFSVGTATPVTLTVTVTASNGCVSSSTVPVPVAPSLSATVSGTDTTVCARSGVTIYATFTGTPPFYVIWSDGVEMILTTNQILHVVNPTVTTTYSIVSINDASGCPGSSSGSVTITVPQPSAEITAPDTLCAGSTGNTASVPDNGDGATYEWVVTNGTLTSGQSTRSITFTAGDKPTVSLYAAVIVPPGCKVSSGKPIPMACVAEIASTAPIVAAPSAKIEASLQGTPPWNLTWSDGYVQNGVVTSPTVRTVNPLRPTTYSLTAVASGSCAGAVVGSVEVVPSGIGDADADGSITISDVFYLINTIFAHGPAPKRSGDANQDGVVDISDVFFLINYIFAGGPPPPRF